MIEPELYPEDVTRIVNVMVAAGIPISRVEAEAAWASHSADWLAGWLALPELDHMIVDAVKEYLQRDIP